MVEEYERVQESNVENTTERIHASPPRSTAASASGVTVDNHDNDDQEETRKLVESSNSGGDAQEEEKEENEEYENPEHDLPATAVVVSRDAEANRVVSPIARQASSDDEDNDYLHAHGSGGEYFEDEPEDRLPKASPKRLAARLERRKQARKQKQFQQQEKHAPRPSKASLGLPKFEPLPKPLDQDDDESSHWSSSDGELVDEERKGAAWLSKDDIEICKRLDEEYERALEEREVVYAARYNSVRQSACFSVFFMLFYLALGTYFFTRQTNWTVPESVLFSIYTITTVGYGHLHPPQTPAFQLYTIFFIFIGIAGITLMVAQTYQCIALEASRAEHAREQAKLAEHRAGNVARLPSPRLAAASSAQANGEVPGPRNNSSRIAQQVMVEMNIPNHWIDRIFWCADRTRTFLVTTEMGRSISVVLPFVGLILIGAMVVGPLEGWTMVESIYFAVVSLTTVGFGDYYPTRNASILFCIIWLPCSIGFMSLFLTNVAAFYIRLSDKNIERIERQLRQRVRLAKEQARREREAAKRRALRGQDLENTVPSGSAGDNDDDGDATGVALVNTDKGQVKPEQAEQSSEKSSEEDVHLFGSPEEMGLEDTATRREKILNNHKGQWHRDDGAESDGSGDSLIKRGKGLATMKDLIRAVHANLPKEASKIFRPHGPENEILSVRSNRFIQSNSLRQGSLRKPSFALRALVQERFAEIIAAEVAGFESSIEIKDNTLSVTINTLRQTANKWMIPRRARRAFRAVAFEALYFVGEHGLITRGADALFELSPLEFHRLFTPLLAALGDADSMEAWLSSTDILAEVDLNRISPAAAAAKKHISKVLRDLPEPT